MTAHNRIAIDATSFVIALFGIVALFVTIWALMS